MTDENVKPEATEPATTTSVAAETPDSDVKVDVVDTAASELPYDDGSRVIEITHGSVVLHDVECQHLGGPKAFGGAYHPGAVLRVSAAEATKLTGGRSPDAKLADRPKPNG